MRMLIQPLPLWRSLKQFTMRVALSLDSGKSSSHLNDWQRPVGAMGGRSVKALNTLARQLQSDNPHHYPHQQIYNPLRFGCT